MREFYHTQEKREDVLEEPLICNRDNAWLGNGYYFWCEEDDAHSWGNKSKHKTGKYQIYIAKICTDESMFDTVFNEVHYYTWKKWVEKTALTFIKKYNHKPNLKEFNNLLLENNFYKKCGIKCLLFQDLPFQEQLLVEGFPYRKRIQLAVYDKDIINSFKLHTEERCQNVDNKRNGR